MYTIHNNILKSNQFAFTQRSFQDGSFSFCVCHKAWIIWMLWFLWQEWTITLSILGKHGLICTRSKNIKIWDVYTQQMKAESQCRRSQTEWRSLNCWVNYLNKYCNLFYVILLLQIGSQPGFWFFSSLWIQWPVRGV